MNVKFTTEEQKKQWRENQRLGVHLVKVKRYSGPARSEKPLSKEKLRRFKLALEKQGYKCPSSGRIPSGS